MAEAAGDDDPIEIDIDPELVAFIIVKARAFDVKEPPLDDDPGSNPADGGEREILEDLPDDATALELEETLAALNEDAAADLLAITWIGRGDFTRGEWQEARALAVERREPRLAAYFMGIPNLGDLIEEGFAQIGYSLDEYQVNRL
jgi:hypothetical protein